MTAEQLYSLAMLQLALVLLLASFRVQPVHQDAGSLRYFQAALLFDAISWLFYLWPERFVWLSLSNTAAACSMWLLLLYAFSRCGRPLRWFWVVPLVCLQAFGYTLLIQQSLVSWSLHFMTALTALVALPSAWLFCCVKTGRTVSDQSYAVVMLAWFLVCVLRSVTVEVAPDWVLSGYQMSQLLWPAIVAAYGLFVITGYLEEAQQQLKTDAMLDPLTGLLNRRGFEQALVSNLALHRRYQHPLAVLMLDLDHFKQMNDLHGHDVGDAVLMNVAGQLKQRLRQSDILARFGGEEFVIVLPMTGAADAYQIAGQLRQLIAASAITGPVTAHSQQTVSIGLSMQTADYNVAQQLKQADLALYQAKKQGRNQVVCFDASMSFTDNDC